MKGEVIMKKSNLAVGIIFAVAGIAFFIMAGFDTPFQSLLCGFGGAGLGPGIMMISKYIYWSQPKNKERYDEKLNEEAIEMHDERKEALRGKTARYMYAYTLVIVGISIMVFQILDKLITIEDSKIFIIYLGFLFFSELVLSSYIYKRLNKKY